MRNLLILLLLVQFSFRTLTACAETQEIPDQIAVSPKAPWHDFELTTEDDEITLRKTLLWLPNRFLDLVDIFRVDAGVGPSFGAVVRVSKYFQAGYRSFSPASLRIGDFGRHEPWLLEQSSEFGFSPFYSKSRDRSICSGEVAVAADLFIVGLHAGVCLDQLFDFITGIAFFDPNGDDLR